MLDLVYRWGRRVGPAALESSSFPPARGCWSRTKERDFSCRRRRSGR